MKNNKWLQYAVVAMRQSCGRSRNNNSSNETYVSDVSSSSISVGNNKHVKNLQRLKFSAKYKIFVGIAVLLHQPLLNILYYMPQTTLITVYFRAFCLPITTTIVFCFLLLRAYHKQLASLQQAVALLFKREFFLCTIYCFSIVSAIGGFRFYWFDAEQIKFSRQNSRKCIEITGM
ncbi:unnamed protein product [Ceratitis capitata]|uniref:(Mediterranean fruit fly) hypothetical protein n=1 Tax=Ceratitis capitata TaxID=7213 RepID=A0A811V2H7_CERCA|nr:unnamed protein product [Ceratitis capitata]